MPGTLNNAKETLDIESSSGSSARDIMRNTIRGITRTNTSVAIRCPVKAAT